MKTSRLEAFSDGVLAIIITIMVLELKMPHAVDLAALKPLLPVRLSYVLSFIYLGIDWNNSITGEGLTEALTGTQVVVDVTNSPSWEDKAVLEFFETSTRNVLAAEVKTGVSHHVALSRVGCDRLPASGYLRAKSCPRKIDQGFANSLHDCPCDAVL